jgi:hypothetical protein
MTVCWDIWGIILMMQAVTTSETQVSFYQTAQNNIPEGSSNLSP